VRKFLMLSSMLLLLVLVLNPAASAQTKISGTNQCAKPDPQNMIAIGDKTDHSFGIGQTKCSWSKPWEIEGIAGKQGMGTFSGETTGNTMRFHAFYVDEMANGDKAIYQYQGSMTLKDGAIQSEKGTWTLVRGTGKLKGVTGKGTYSGKPSADGGMTYEVEGEYMPPKMKM
jgi:hypothetical protein